MTQRNLPDDTTYVHDYETLAEFAETFRNRAFNLLVIVGPSGTGKSKIIENAISPGRYLEVRGRCTEIKFFEDLYRYRTDHIVVDDADDFMRSRLAQEYIKIFAETGATRTLKWTSSTKILANNGCPASFTSSSPMCIILNWWKNDPLFNALSSRAEVIYFDPPWDAVYRYAATWFEDQEILDYVHERLDVLTQPDLRIFDKAVKRKRAGMVRATWQGIIDSKVDGHHGLIARRLMDDPSLSEPDRVRRYKEETGRSRATWFRDKQEIQRWRPKTKQPRLLVAAAKVVVPPKAKAASKTRASRKRATRKSARRKRIPAKP